MADVPSITLNNGVEIPQLGFGTFQIERDDAVKATLVALEAGYRHIDTAQMYGNEAEIGDALHTFDAPREEIFVTSKLNNGNHGREDALRSFDETLGKLGLDQLDLFLMHWPMPGVGDFVDTWRAMIEMHESGRVKAIGVSNFQTHHLQRILDETDVVPVVNQIECHPYFHNDVVRRFGAEHDIVTEAWSPIAQGDVIDDATLSEIGDRLGKSAAQVTLRWHLQRGDVVFPKSTTPERVEENMDIFDFELAVEDMDRIAGLDRNERKGPDPDEFNMVP
ncbi:MAG: aldo/keto reductase [Acidimicrobiales bacterium]|nr:aldo/keto reductase [Acidimicrobiales bacterium]